MNYSDIIKYKSKVRIVLRPAKTWSQPSTKKDPEYGFTFKLFKIEPPGVSSANNDNNEIIDDRLFLSKIDESSKNINELMKLREIIKYKQVPNYIVIKLEESISQFFLIRLLNIYII